MILLLKEPLSIGTGFWELKWMSQLSKLLGSLLLLFVFN